MTIPTRITRLRMAIRYRNVPETRVPMIPPKVATVEFELLSWPMIARAANVSPIPSANTTDEWPSENQKPTESGRLPSDMSLRVVLSIAEMWSASNA